MSNSKGLSTILLIVIILAVGIIGAAGGYYYGTNSTATTTSLITAAQTTPKQTTSVVATGQATTAVSMADWKTYTSDQLGLSFKYPANWFVDERQASSGKNFTLPAMVQISDNQQEINFRLKENSVGTPPDFKVSGTVTRETNLAMFGKTEQDYLRFEAGRSAPPITEERFGQQGDVKTYRGIRQNKKGEVTNESGDIASYTTTELTYTFFKNNVLYGFRVVIRGDDYKEFTSVLDEIASTFQFTK